MLAPAQYLKSAQVRKNSQERADFAVRMPGSGEEEVLLPIDAKFPQEDYERLLAAYDAGDAAQVAQQGRALAEAIRVQARSIRDKYLNPPITTDFAILYLPVEGLYAEVLRQEGLVESLQRDCRVTVAGPTTLSALLTSLQMGFRTLAIEKRSAEVWRLLGAVKGDFGRFAQVLEKTQRALTTATNSIDDAARKTRTIERRLRTVEELPEAEAAELLAEEA
jgi:DNA recombination protein RmuC